MEMRLRKYKPSDFDTVSKLFYDTIHAVNGKDYTQEQCNAWTAKSDCLKKKRGALKKQHTVLAEQDGMIVGFGSVDDTGCLDLLYVHKDYQKQGIATALCKELEKDFTVMKTHASLTAKPFFEACGYVAIQAQEVDCLGIKLKNYVMEKHRSISDCQDI